MKDSSLRFQFHFFGTFNYQKMTTGRISVKYYDAIMRCIITKLNTLYTNNYFGQLYLYAPSALASFQYTENRKHKVTEMRYVRKDSAVTQRLFVNHTHTAFYNQRIKYS